MCVCRGGACVWAEVGEWSREGVSVFVCVFVRVCVCVGVFVCACVCE